MYYFMLKLNKCYVMLLYVWSLLLIWTLLLIFDYTWNSYPKKIFCCLIRSAPLGSPAPISSLAATNDQDSKKENKAEDPRTKVRLTFKKIFLLLIILLSYNHAISGRVLCILVKFKMIILLKIGINYYQNIYSSATLKRITHFCFYF